MSVALSAWDLPGGLDAVTYPFHLPTHLLVAAHPLVLVAAGAALAAMLVLAMYDVALPSAEPGSLAAPVCAVSLVLFGPAVAAILTVVELTAVAAFCVARGIAGRTGVRFASRAVAIVVCSGLLLLTGAAARGPLAALLAFGLSVPFLASERLTTHVLQHRGEGGLAAAVIWRALRVESGFLVVGCAAAGLYAGTYTSMGSWGLIPVVALLLLWRQSSALLFDVDETYARTAAVLVRGAETQDGGVSGRGEETARIAHKLGIQSGLAEPMLRRVYFAALLRDLDAVRAEILAPVLGASKRSEPHTASGVLGEDFFSELGIRPILQCSYGMADSVDIAADEQLAGLLVALAADLAGQVAAPSTTAELTSFDCAARESSSHAVAVAMRCARRLQDRWPLQ